MRLVYSVSTFIYRAARVGRQDHEPRAGGDGEIAREGADGIPCHLYERAGPGQTAGVGMHEALQLLAHNTMSFLFGLPLAF